MHFMSHALNMLFSAHNQEITTMSSLESIIIRICEAADV